MSSEFEDLEKEASALEELRERANEATAKASLATFRVGRALNRLPRLENPEDGDPVAEFGEANLYAGQIYADSTWIKALFEFEGIPAVLKLQILTQKDELSASYREQVDGDNTSG